MNLGGSLYSNSLIPPTWYLIFILHIPPSLVHSLCLNYTVALVPPLYTSNSDSFIFLSIFYLLFHLTLASMHFLWVFFFQNFGPCFHFNLLSFLLTYCRQNQENKKFKIIQEQNHYSSRRQMMEFLPQPSPDFPWGHP